MKSKSKTINNQSAKWLNLYFSKDYILIESGLTCIGLKHGPHVGPAGINHHDRLTSQQRIMPAA
jgi:hypothetical protein